MNPLAIIAVILLVLLILAIPGWPHNAGWNLGPWPSGGLGLILLIVLIILLVR